MNRLRLINLTSFAEVKIQYCSGSTLSFPKCGVGFSQLFYYSCHRWSKAHSHQTETCFPLQVNLRMRVRVSYTSRGSLIQDTVQVDSFPGCSAACHWPWQQSNSLWTNQQISNLTDLLHYWFYLYGCVILLVCIIAGLMALLIWQILMQVSQKYPNICIFLGIVQSKLSIQMSPRKNHAVSIFTGC